MHPSLRRILYAAAAFLGLWLAFKYLLGLLLPFLLGTAVALSAEPAVNLLQQRIGLKRNLAAGLGVTATLALLGGLLSLVGALAVKELARLAATIPDLQETALEGMALLQGQLLRLAERAPEGVQPLLQKTVLSVFDGRDRLMEQAAGRLPGIIGGALSRVPGGALGVGTGLLAGFMISARLPRLRTWINARLPQSWKEKTLPALGRIRRSLWGWIKAQGKLATVTWLIVTAGFLLLRIPYAPVWALGVALVDAVPVLGTGTVLVPWAVIELLRSNGPQAVGLLLIYAAAMLTRTVLEPRLVGKQLGLDPLVTLFCFYLGFRLWGVAGMLLAPLLAAATKAATEATP